MRSLLASSEEKRADDLSSRKTVIRIDNEDDEELDDIDELQPQFEVNLILYSIFSLFAFVNVLTAFNIFKNI